MNAMTRRTRARGFPKPERDYDVVADVLALEADMRAALGATLGGGND